MEKQILSGPTRACLPSFEQLIEQQMVQLQDSILECLHHHTLFSMLSDKIFKIHRAQILSCYGPRTIACLIVQPIFPSFQLASSIFFTTFQIRLGLPHPSIACIPQCMYTHPIDPKSIHLLHCVHGNECIKTHDVIHDTFVVIEQDVWLPCEAETTTCTSFKHIQLFMSKSSHCAHQRWHLHLSQCCHCQPNTSGFIVSDVV
jgi:hypothetical protein